ncbi:MAG: shikimate dehydrogenase [Rhizobiaceae bacterium]|nr:MAG: shikimate dehydrogenase [Rhizobiaceae bacterium]CAG1012799.1 shikimate dehydrogenase [Rhizobiaceae bacterium]
MAEPPRKAFVCGHPIAHSRSPKIHAHWLRSYGIDGSYEAIDVTVEAFPAFMKKLRRGDFAGGNVTLPHKETAFLLADRRDAAAAEIGAVNTLWVADGLVYASNTDAYGFAANLDERAPGWDLGRIAVVMGAGGAARAVVQALKTRGFAEIRIVNRTAARAKELADRFGTPVSAHGTDACRELCGDADLLVNTTSLGMSGDNGVPADPAWLPDRAVVTDIVYVPLNTPLLAAAKRRGLTTVDGLGMLLHQAVPGFQRWFGTRPVVTKELRDIIDRDIEQR